MSRDSLRREFRHPAPPAGETLGIGQGHLGRDLLDQVVPLPADAAVPHPEPFRRVGREKLVPPRLLRQQVGFGLDQTFRLEVPAGEMEAASPPGVSREQSKQHLMTSAPP